MNKIKNAFTLVELIVVITILAILGTIAFISLQGYSTSARDSTRISDMGSMKSTLELYQLDAGKYPNPTNGVNITYSGATVWNQGTFGDTVFANVSKLDKIPKDPVTDKEYTYSIISNKNEYQLGGILEGDDISIRPPLTPPYQSVGLATANASLTTAKAYTTGKYNGQMVKSLSGTTCNVLALPSIISNNTNITDIQQIISSGSLVYRGYNNLPSSFKGSKFNEAGGFAFTPNLLVAYTDTGSCSPLTDTSSYTARVNLIKGLQDAYSGTLVQNEGEIKNIVGLNININSPSSDVITYAGNFINNVMGSNIYAGTQLNTNCGLGYSWNGTNCTANYYPGCNTPNIVVGSYEISACNVGATIAGTGATSYGNYFQWGNNAAMLSSTSTGGTQVNTIGFGPGNYYSNTVFITGYGDWSSNQNDNLWGNTENSSVSRKGPCASGYHIPSKDEWIGLVSAGGWGNDGTSMINLLLLPMAGGRAGATGNMSFVGGDGYYWSSSPNATSAYYLYFYQTLINPSNTKTRASGNPIRCFKN